MKKLLIAITLISLLSSCQSQNQDKDGFCFTHTGLTPVKMNILYEGVDNPIKIFMVNHNPDSININVSQGELSKVSTWYNISNLTIGEVFFEFHKGDKLLSGWSFRVKELPKPTLSLNGVNDSRILPSQLEAITNINGILLDFDFYVVPQINTFNIKIIREGTLISENNNVGSELSDTNKAIIRQSKIGDIVLLDDIEFDYVWFPGSERERILKSGNTELVYYVMY
jgi:hypothetical protein